MLVSICGFCWRVLLGLCCLPSGQLGWNFPATNELASIVPSSTCSVAYLHRTEHHLAGSIEVFQATSVWSDDESVHVWIENLDSVIFLITKMLLLTRMTDSNREVKPIRWCQRSCRCFWTEISGYFHRWGELLVETMVGQRTFSRYHYQSKSYLSVSIDKTNRVFMMTNTQ